MFNVKNFLIPFCFALVVGGCNDAPKSKFSDLSEKEKAEKRSQLFGDGKQPMPKRGENIGGI